MQEPLFFGQAADDRRPARVGKSDGHPDGDPFGGAQEDLPALARQFILTAGEQEDLDQSAGLLPADETRRKDAGVVDDDRVARADVFRKIAERTDIDTPRLPVHDHHPGEIPDRGGFLGDQFFRKGVVEFFKFHINKPTPILSAA